MSTDWGYRCLTCNAESPQWWNHGQPQLQAIARHRSALLAARRAMLDDRDLGAWVEFSVLGIYEGPDPIVFLADHEGHEIELINEYGKHVALEKEPTNER